MIIDPAKHVGKPGLRIDRKEWPRVIDVDLTACTLHGARMKAKEFR